ncbi:MAG: hypothetical protein V3V56_00020 [bacterium]
MARITAIEGAQAWVSDVLHLEIYKREAADNGTLGESESRPMTWMEIFEAAVQEGSLTEEDVPYWLSVATKGQKEGNVEDIEQDYQGGVSL